MSKNKIKQNRGRLCFCVFVCVCAHTHTHTHTHPLGGLSWGLGVFPTDSHKNRGPFVCVCVCVFVCTQKHTNTQTQKHIYSGACPGDLAFFPTDPHRNRGPLCLCVFVFLCVFCVFFSSTTLSRVLALLGLRPARPYSIVPQSCGIFCCRAGISNPLSREYGPSRVFFFLGPTTYLPAASPPASPIQ